MWRGSFTLKGQNCDERVRPGKRVNITGGQTSWETMNGIIQEVSHDIFSGVTQATFGPPLQSGPSDLLQRLINLRRIRPATNDNLRNRDEGWTAGTGSDDEEKDEDVVANGNVKALMAVQTAAGNEFEPKIVRLPKKTQTFPFPRP
jgi:hypothetical protein